MGRQTELEILRQALEQAQVGHGQVVAVLAEPGMGKSRLFWEFLQSLHTHGWRVLASRAVAYGKATVSLPVIDLLKAYFQIDASDNAHQRRAKVTGTLLTLDSAMGLSLPAVLALLDVPVEEPQWQALEPRQRRQRTLEACRHLLLRESQVQPLLVVFEDLHWIDAETQAFLDHLVESLPAARLLLLVNYRPEYQHDWGSKTYYTQFRLDALPAESAAELLQALLGDDPGLAPLKRLLIERSEGNPFFLEESIRTLVETGVLVGEPGAYRLAHALPTIQLPATVQAVLAARIDRLPSAEKRLLQTAAVIGTEVPLPLLQAIAELPEDALHRGLAHLQATEFLYETCLFPEHAYTFKHALTHEVAYGGLLQERRRALHAQIVDAIERLPPTAWPTRSNGWPTMPSRVRCGTRPASTADRRAPRQPDARLSERRWRTLSRRWGPSSISPTVATCASRPLISASICAMPCIPSANTGGSSTTCARPNPWPRLWATAGGWDSLLSIWLPVCDCLATLTGAGGCPARAGPGRGPGGCRLAGRRQCLPGRTLPVDPE